MIEDVRCPHCNRLLLRGYIVEGTIEIKCRSEVCRGTVVRIEALKVQ